LEPACTFRRRAGATVTLAPLQGAPPGAQSSPRRALAATTSGLATPECCCSTSYVSPVR
jgi:hypothetical protein